MADARSISLLDESPVTSQIPEDIAGEKIAMKTRKARLCDAEAIYQLVDSFSYDGTLLHRSYMEICENIETFTIVETDLNEFAGCAALHVYGSHLAEVRSIVVRAEVKGHGAGGLLVQSLLHQAEESGIQCVCLFTRIPDFFEHFRFRTVEHQALRDKVLKDCLHCARRHSCDETAMAVGELPALHDRALGDFMPTQRSGDLVQLYV